MIPTLTRVVKRMEWIEKGFDSIFIRVGDESIPLSELPAKVATQHVFKWLREVINAPEENKEDESLIR